MSVYQDRRSKLWRYDFWFQERRHTHAGLETRADAEEAEAALKRTLRRRAAGLEALDAADTPRFSDWAAVTLRYQRTRKKLKRPDEAKNTLRMVLAFWGGKPRTDPVSSGEYRDLRLGDPIQRPELIGDFEHWMETRKLSGARKNHYRSACSMMYRVALLPEYRSRSGVRENPFAHVERDRVRRRTAVLSPDQIVQWMHAAPLPVVVAVALGSLAPALRLQNVIDLRRDQLSPDRAFLTVPHKTDRETGQPLTLAISSRLREVLAEVERQHPKDPYVVPLEGERYWQLVKLIKRSIVAAGLRYGRAAGVTFHTLRHSMNTWLARQRELTSAERRRAMGHETAAMTAWYEHLAGADTVRPMELLGTQLPIADAALARLQILNKARGTLAGPVKSTRKKAKEKPRRSRKSSAA